MAALKLLETKGLSRYFDGLKAVDGVDFALEPGEIRAIIGPNGAGKSTFVSLLSGRYSATAGQVMFEGEDISDLPAHARVRKGIAYTFQITNIYAAMTVSENIAVAVQNRMKPRLLSRKRLRDSLVRQEVQRVAERLGLAELLERQAGELAYGHQRLLEVAMGLALEPRLLILDEPTQGLSDSEIADFKALVRRVNDSATILLIEHNMDVVMSLAHRVTVLNQGQILAEGTPSEIAANAAVQAAYLGEPAE